jgi:uncharacterized protein
MAALPKALFWRRLDAPGAEHTLVDDAAGLHARGTMAASVPVPFVCRYELYTDDAWATARFEVTAEGAGFLRVVRLERAASRWRVTASEQGDLDAILIAAGHPRAGLPGAEDPYRLDAALDVDLGYSPLTNTLPVRRLAPLEPGAAHTIEVAWVLLPGLEVVPSEQTYTSLGPDRVRFASGSFTADIALDTDGYVTHYPGLAERVI